MAPLCTASPSQLARRARLSTKAARQPVVRPASARVPHALLNQRHTSSKPQGHCPRHSGIPVPDISIDAARQAPLPCRANLDHLICRERKKCQSKDTHANWNVRANTRFRGTLPRRPFAQRRGRALARIARPPGCRCAAIAVLLAAQLTDAQVTIDFSPFNLDPDDIQGRQWVENEPEANDAAIASGTFFNDGAGLQLIKDATCTKTISTVGYTGI